MASLLVLNNQGIGLGEIFAGTGVAVACFCVCLYHWPAGQVSSLLHASVSLPSPLTAWIVNSVGPLGAPVMHLMLQKKEKKECYQALPCSSPLGHGDCSPWYQKLVYNHEPLGLGSFFALVIAGLSKDKIQVYF